MKSRVICVLGMHRSGTSCLAGTLQEAGVFLGDVVTRAPHNLKGNRENMRIMSLHDNLLKRTGGTWDEPPPEVHWQPRHRSEQRDILREYADVPLWGSRIRALCSPWMAGSTCWTMWS